MPLRINLLAEAQAIEEMRRRDPVKRVIGGGALLVACMLVWSSVLYGKIVYRKGELSRTESFVHSKSNDYRRAIENIKTLNDGKLGLAALHSLSTNRFLVGNLLDAMQHLTVDNVQLVRFKVDQLYNLTDAVKEKKNGDRTIPARPASATEKIILTLDARDTSPTPGDMVNKFQQTLTAAEYFRTMLGKTNEFGLLNTSQPVSDPDGRQFVLFTLQCTFPEKTR